MGILLHFAQAFPSLLDCGLQGVDAEHVPCPWMAYPPAFVHNADILCLPATLVPLDELLLRSMVWDTGPECGAQAGCAMLESVDSALSALRWRGIGGHGTHSSITSTMLADMERQDSLPRTGLDNDAAEKEIAEAILFQHKARLRSITWLHSRRCARWRHDVAVLIASAMRFASARPP